MTKTANALELQTNILSKDSCVLWIKHSEYDEQSVQSQFTHEFYNRLRLTKMKTVAM